MSVKRGIILADAQWPHHNAKLLKSWEEYLASQTWDYLIYLGDFADMDALSHHAMSAGDWRNLEGKRLKSDYDEMSAILRRHRAIVGDDCDMFFLFGNHEEWAEKFVNKYPMLEGMLELEHNLPFEELNIDLVGYRQTLQIADLHFVHGDFGAYTPVYHAKKNVDMYNRNLVYGHHHTLQVATRVAPVGDKKVNATCIPAMANIAPAWAGGRPNQWLNGFGVFYTFDNKRHNLYPIVADGATFISPEGRIYGTSKKVKAVA